MTVATADGATEFDQFGNVKHSFSIDASSAQNTSILTNNINSVAYLDGQTVFGYNITGGIEIIQRLTDLTGLSTYFDWLATDEANPDTNVIDDGTHTTATWSNDETVDYTWNEPNSNGTTYDYQVTAIDTDAEISTEATATGTMTLPITTYETVCNTSATGTTLANTQTGTNVTCDFADGSENYVHVRTQDDGDNFSDWIHQ